MLRLDLVNEPRWHDLPHGVRLQLRPATTQMMMEVFEESAGAEGEKVGTDVPFGRRVARRAVIDWEGVGGPDGPAPVTPEHVDALLEVCPIWQWFQRHYLGPALGLVQEGNGSGPSPTGTSAAGSTTAGPAKASATTAPDGSTRP